VSFDRIARHYRLLETIGFGPDLQRARVFWVDKITRPQRVLILGEGNGRFLCELLRVYPNVTVDCVDASVQMLKLARARVLATRPESFAQVCFLHQDILTWSTQDAYDLLVTHFFLDCFRCDEMKAIIDKLTRAAAPNAAWLLADFTIPARGVLVRAHAKLCVRMMYWLFRSVAGISADELVDPSPYLQANGFARTSCQLSRTGMLKSELWQRNRTPR
jgi:ubiquinone/menaquinone biosynthesis C-methylase UbiE